MKLTNKLVEKFGADKLLHFSIGALIPALGSMVNMATCLLSGALLLIVSIIKEKKLDDYSDLKDLLATGIGTGSSILLYYIINILKQLLFT